jgi:hypothetical protein
MDSGSDKPKLWRESFRLLWAAARGWAPYALIFVVLLIPANAWEISQAGPYSQKVNACYENFLTLISDGQDPASAYTTTQDQIAAIPKPNILTDIVPTALSLLALYFFYIRLLAASSVLKAPKASLRGLGYMLLKLFQKYVIVIVPPVVLGSLCAVVMIVPLAPVVQALACLLLLTGAVVSGGYFFCRYTVVVPLALSGVSSGLKLSGTLTKDNIWRLAGGYGVITTILLPPMLAISIVPMLAGAPETPVLLGLAALVAVSQIVMGVVFAAFGCVAFAALYSEKQAADLSFKLLLSP